MECVTRSNGGDSGAGVAFQWRCTMTEHSSAPTSRVRDSHTHLLDSKLLVGLDLDLTRLLASLLRDERNLSLISPCSPCLDPWEPSNAPSCSSRTGSPSHRAGRFATCWARMKRVDKAVEVERWLAMMVVTDGKVSVTTSGAVYLGLPVSFCTVRRL